MKKYKLIALYFIVLMPLLTNGQDWLRYTKKEVMRGLSKNLKSNDFSATIQHTDSTITFLVRDSNFVDLDVIYYLDNQGRVEKETHKSICDSCYKKYTNALLQNKKYGWKMLSKSFYISKFSKRIIMQISSLDFEYSLIYMPWNRNQYEELLGTE